MPQAKPNIQGIEEARKSITQVYLTILVIAVFLIISIKAFNQQILDINAYNSKIWAQESEQYEILNRRVIFLNTKEMEVCYVLESLINRLNGRRHADRDLVVPQMLIDKASYLDATLSFVDTGQCGVDLRPEYDPNWTLDWKDYSQWESKILSASRLLHAVAKTKNLPAPEKAKLIRIGVQTLGLRPNYNEEATLLIAISDANSVTIRQTDDVTAYRFIVQGRLGFYGFAEGGMSDPVNLLTAPLLEADESGYDRRMIALKSLFHHAAPDIPSNAELFDATNPYSYVTAPREDSVSIPFTTSTIEARFVLLLGGGILVLMYSAFLAKFSYVRSQMLLGKTPDYYPTLPVLDAEINPVVGILRTRNFSSASLIWISFLVFPLLYFSLGVLFRFNFVDVGYVAERGEGYVAVIRSFVDYSGSGALFASDISNIVCLALSLAIVRRILITPLDFSLEPDVSKVLLLICLLPIFFVFTFPILGLIDDSFDPEMFKNNFLLLFTDRRIYTFFVCAALWSFFVIISPLSVRVFFTFVTWFIMSCVTLIYGWQ